MYDGVPGVSMSLSKRILDLLLAVILFVVLSPFFCAVIGWMILKNDRPIFYISERMKALDRPFRLVKFRTMRAPRSGQVNTGVSGGDKSDRITPLGHMLRGARLDEIPQLWNVLKGDMSFVGARPPLRRYTEMFPDVYRTVLASPPGITGLASIMYHRTEARLIGLAQTPEETEAIYVARCIPQKARLDRFYLAHQSLGFDLYILYLTAAKIVPLPGRRARKIRS